MSPHLKRLREKVGNDPLFLPSVSAVIVDNENRVLLHRASDDGKWYIIGGAMEPGEEPADAVVREVLEETGLKVEPLRIVAVQASPLIVYPNGHQALYMGTCFLCRVVGGRLHIADDESLELRYFALAELPDLRPDQLQRVRYALSGSQTAFFHPAKK